MIDYEIKKVSNEVLEKSYESMNSELVDTNQPYYKRAIET